MSVEKYSPSTESWEKVADMYDEREYYCACSYMDHVYIIGGCLTYRINSCIKFDTINQTWRAISRMNERRHCAACAVFEGNIVVSGGYNENTVEVYDHVDD